MTTNHTQICSIKRPGRDGDATIVDFCTPNHLNLSLEQAQTLASTHKVEFFSYHYDNGRSFTYFAMDDLRTARQLEFEIPNGWVEYWKLVEQHGFKRNTTTENILVNLETNKMARKIPKERKTNLGDKITLQVSMTYFADEKLALESLNRNKKPETPAVIKEAKATEPTDSKLISEIPAGWINHVTASHIYDMPVLLRWCRDGSIPSHKHVNGKYYINPNDPVTKAAVLRYHDGVWPL